MTKILGLHEHNTLEGQSMGQHGTEKSKENLQERLNVTGKKKNLWLVLLIKQTER